MSLRELYETMFTNTKFTLTATDGSGAVFSTEKAQQALREHDIKGTINPDSCRYSQNFDQRTVNGKETFGFFPRWTCELKENGKSRLAVFDPGRLVIVDEIGTMRAISMTDTAVSNMILEQ